MSWINKSVNTYIAYMGSTGTAINTVSFAEHIVMHEDAGLLLRIKAGHNTYFTEWAM